MAEELEGKEEPKKKGGMLKWIIIVVLLLGIGGGAFFMKDTIMGMLGMGGATEESAAEPTPEERAAAPDFQGIMATVDPFVANLNDPLGKRYIKLGLEVELIDEAAVADFSKSNIKIKNMLLILLGSKKPQEMLGPKNQIRLQQEIVDRVNQIIGEGKVLNIYFSTYILQ